MTTIYYEENNDKSFFDHIYPQSNYFISSYNYQCIFSGINDKINHNKRINNNINIILNDLDDDYFKEEDDNNDNYINIKIGLSKKDYLNYVHDDINNVNCIIHRWGIGTIKDFAEGYKIYAKKIKKLLQTIEFKQYNNLDIKHPLNIFLNILNTLFIYDTFGKAEIAYNENDYSIKYIEFEYNNINICIHLNQLDCHNNNINRNCTLTNINNIDLLNDEAVYYNIIFFYNNNNIKDNILISFYYDCNYFDKEKELQNILLDYMNTRKYLLNSKNKISLINYNLNDNQFINNYYNHILINFINGIHEKKDNKDYKELKHLINDLEYLVNNYCNFIFLIKFNFKNFKNITIDKINTSSNIQLINNIDIDEIDFKELKINIINLKVNELIIKCNELLKKTKKY